MSKYVKIWQQYQKTYFCMYRYVQDEAAQLHGNYIVTVAWKQRLLVIVLGYWDSRSFEVLPVKSSLGKLATVLCVDCILCRNILTYPQMPCNNSYGKRTSLTLISHSTAKSKKQEGKQWHKKDWKTLKRSDRNRQGAEPVVSFWKNFQSDSSHFKGTKISITLRLFSSKHQNSSAF